MSAIGFSRDKDDPKAAAIRAARAQGCMCRPEAKVRKIAPNVSEIVLRHDGWCPLLRRGDRN